MNTSTTSILPRNTTRLEEDRTIQNIGPFDTACPGTTEHPCPYCRIPETD